MTPQLRCDVNMDVNEADEAEQRRLVERHPDFSYTRLIHYTLHRGCFMKP